LQTPESPHWIVEVARSAALAHADALDLPSTTGIGDAWDLAAMQTGVSSEDLAERVAAHYRLRIADLRSADVHARRLIPARVARKLMVIPLRYSDRALTVATSDPVSLEAEREISHFSGRNVQFEVATPATLASAVEETYPPAEERREAAPLPPDTRSGPRVLVVDDDADTRRLLRAVLEQKGFRVEEAGDGSLALAILQDGGAFDLVTLDLQMDEMHGLEVLRQIRSRRATAAVPVIVATGAGDPVVEMQLFEAGADDFVVKPVDPPRFLLRVQAVLRRRGTAWLQAEKAP
jgi:CheY-like chemotaxis protein